LPKVDGPDVLGNIKKSEEFCWIPGVVLTTLEAEREKIVAYDPLVPSYLAKGMYFEKFSNLQKDLGYY